jgi:hypothetical protein
MSTSGDLELWHASGSCGFITRLSGIMSHFAKGCLILFLASCGPRKEPCTQDQRDALITMYSAAADHIIESGACDAYKGKRVEECPAYAAMEAHFTAAEMAMCK